MKKPPEPIPSTNILDRYQQLIEIARDLSSIVDIEILLRRIIQSAVEFTQAEAASILLWDEKKQELSFQAVTNVELEAGLRCIVVPAESIAGWVAVNRRPVFVPDAHQDERFFGQVEEITEFVTRSMIAVPLIAMDKLIGVLEVLNKQVDTFTTDDVELLQAMGAQAALAIENSRLFEQSDLMAGLVHELRTPLSSISAIAYLLQKPGLNDEQRNTLAKTVSEEVERLNELASDFLNLARLEAGKVTFDKAPFEVKEMLEECRVMMAPKAAENQVEIFTQIPTGLPPLMADCNRIRQVIINLVSNAIKYNRPGGRVMLRAARHQNELAISVVDTGLGMMPDEISHLFEKYFRAKSSSKSVPGTGLGLSICKQIVEGHGGKISVQSKPGAGSTFTINLPLDL